MSFLQFSKWRMFGSDKITMDGIEILNFDGEWDAKYKLFSDK